MSGIEQPAGLYEDFTAAVAGLTAGGYENGPLARLAGPPEAEAERLAPAVCTRRPRLACAVRQAR